jgi:dipeptidase D
VDNAISTACEAEIVCDGDQGVIGENGKYFEKMIKEEYLGIDDNISVFVGLKQNGEFEVSDEAGTGKVISVLRAMSQGVIMRNAYDADMVETSLNLGILRVEPSVMNMGYSLRSSYESAKKDLADRVTTIAKSYGGSVKVSGEYPAWTYNPESKVREIAGDIYREQTGEEPVFRTIHAGLECGLFYQNIEGIDILSFGPDIYDIHTFEERLDIESAKRVYELTVKMLEKM